MSLRANGTPLSRLRLPERSRARAAARAASPARWLQARTTGSRAAMRARQLAITASAVNVPSAIRRTSVVADRRQGSASGIAGAPERLSMHIREPGACAKLTGGRIERRWQAIRHSLDFSICINVLQSNDRLENRNAY